MNDGIVNCHTNEQSVSYLYGEMIAAERLSFEEHLLECSVCTDDFAVLADSRYSVYEWQQVEFVSLATPRIVIPYEPARVSWFDSFRAAFTWDLRFTFAAALVILVAGFLITSSISPESDPRDEVVTSSPAAVSSEPVRSEVPAETPNEINVVSTSPVDAEVEISAEPVRTTAAKQKRKTVNQRSRIETVSARNTNRQPEISNPSIPRLNDFENVADESLRLADLVAEGDTRD